jgi:1-acyl-sn-glycerol-3-phosphate acyltransferase
MTITLRIGPIIETQGRKASEVNAEVESWIEAQMASLPCPHQAESK